MREIMPHSLLQCSVEALDDDGFNVRIARYSKTNVIFFKKVLVPRFSLVRIEKLLSRCCSFCYVAVLLRHICLI